MITINNYTYPILNFFGLNTLWEHPMFSSIMQKVPTESVKEEFTDTMRTIQDIYSKRKIELDTWKSLEEITAKRRDAWPILAYDPEDFQRLGPEMMMNTDAFISYLWSTRYHDAIPEVVPAEVWDDAFNYKDDRFYDWLSQGTIHIKGIMIRPSEKATSMYFMHQDKEKKNDIATSMCLMDRYLMMFQANESGFISTNLNVPHGFKDLAAKRGISVEQAYFQEDIYNILKYHHYVHVAGKGKSKLMRRGDTETFNGTTYRSYTDTPLMFITD